MEKVKLAEVVNGITEESFKEALGKSCNKLKGATDEELKTMFGMSDYQYTHFYKALSRSFNKKLESGINEIFVKGDSLEVPHQFQAYVHESEARKNENGNPAKKLSIRTRRGLKGSLNK